MAVKATYSGCSNIWNRFNGAGTAGINLSYGVGTPGSAQKSDVALFKPSPDAEARVAGAVTFGTTGFLADTIKISGTITDAGTNKAITEASLHDTTTASPTTTFTSVPTTTAGTSGTVGSATGFPGSGNYFIQVDLEVMLVTGGQGTTTWTVVRASLGSTAATHTNGVQVTLGGDGGASGMSGATSAQTATVGSGQGGSMTAHADFSAVNLNIGDALTNNWSEQLVP